jgi:hypothetical protein
MPSRLDKGTGQTQYSRTAKFGSTTIPLDTSTTKYILGRAETGGLCHLVFTQWIHGMFKNFAKPNRESARFGIRLRFALLEEHGPKH